jgi:hypothetical protein
MTAFSARDSDGLRSAAKAATKDLGSAATQQALKPITLNATMKPAAAAAAAAGATQAVVATLICCSSRSCHETTD